MISKLEQLDVCLKRSDIAKILRVSAKQAGRLMQEMPTFRIGRTHRRVMRADFENWLSARREVAALGATLRRASIGRARRAAASRYVGIKSSSDTGSVMMAAQKLREREARSKM